VVLVSNNGATASSTGPTNLILGATVMGAVDGAAQVVSDCTLLLLPTFSGTGGIEVQGGTVKTAGVPKYSGTFTIDSFFFKTTAGSPLNFPLVTLTSAVFPLGTGSLVITTANSAFLLAGGAVLDASALPQGVMLANALMFQNGGTLSIVGTVTITDTVSVSEYGSLNSGLHVNDNSKLMLKNGVQGSGRLVLNFGDFTVTGNIAAGVTLDVGFLVHIVTVSLGADLLGALGGTPQVAVGGTADTLQLMPGLTGTGGIDLNNEGAILQSNVTTTYSGNISLEGGAEVVLGPASNPLGTGQLLVQSAQFDATQAPQGVTLGNALTFKPSTQTSGGGRLYSTGTLTFTGLVTLSGAGDTLQESDGSDEQVLSGGIQGTGTLQFGGPGIATVTGDVAAGVGLIADEIFGLSRDLPDVLNLGANLQGETGANQVTVTNATIHLLRNLSGTGGIDMRAGTLQSDGLPFYSGTITVEQQYPNPTAVGLGLNLALPDPDIVLTSGAAELGTGTVVLASPVAGANPAFMPPLLDAGGLAGGVTLSNPVSAQPGATLTISGAVTFSGVTTVVGQSNYVTTSAGDHLNFSGSIQGLGTIVVDGPGTTSITGSVATGASFLTAGTLTGTLAIAGVLNGVSGGSTQVTVTAGTVSLLGNASGSGPIDVEGGMLQATGSPGYFGPIALGAGGAILDLDSSDDKGLGTGNLTLKGGLLQNASGANAVIDNPVTVVGTVTIDGVSRLKLTNSLNLSSGILNADGTVVLTGGLSGSAGLVLQGDAFEISSSNPGFTGQVTVISGVVQVLNTANNALGSGPMIAKLTAQGVLQTVSTIGDPILDNPLVVQAGELTLNGQFTFPFGITVDTGATLEIEGAGTQIISSGALSGGGTIIVQAGTFSTPGGTSGFTGSLQFQGGQVTPTLTVTDPGGIANGSPFPATAMLSAPGLSSPVSSLEGITPTFTYYTGSSPAGIGTNTAPTAPGTYTVVGSFIGSTNYTSAKSSPVIFTITSAEKLVFFVQPHNSEGSTLDPIIVLIENAQGQLATSDNSTVTLSIGSGSGTLGGTVTAKAHHGIAIFDRLLLTKPGGYTLEATDGGDTSAFSHPFYIIAAPPHHRRYDLDDGDNDEGS
jgi:hypothetical protein